MRLVFLQTYVVNVYIHNYVFLIYREYSERMNLVIIHTLSSLHNCTSSEAPSQPSSEFNGIGFVHVRTFL